MNIHRIALVGLAAACAQAAAIAQTAPPAAQASPGVYKVLAENDQFRIELATWKPGEKDNMHSHPASAVYRLSDCTARLTGPDGKVLGEGEAKAGSAALQPPIAAHSLENIGKTECQILIVERK
ncbi:MULTISPECIES: cupin domain-containing protein [Ramlibacter]|uniref:Cupin domain-containing protein n=1 Tax=Ramlibacter aquaticus TaxID=2780094 RepID=A0ABR9SC29_9BURK|nr:MULTISPECIES: cupin domain-containing protein [Ramlibacter]MBE7939906.1 cupin domain-containing protein [Ramlibacter aquaticus]